MSEYESLFGKKDPYTSFRFKIELDGNTIVAAFSEVSGLVVETDVKTFTEGGVNDFEYKIPKHTKQTSLVLKKGMTDDTSLWDWFQKTIDGKVERKSGSIIILSHNGLPEARWNFSKAFPVKWEGPSFNAGTTNAVAIESLTLVHQGLLKK